MSQPRSILPSKNDSQNGWYSRGYLPHFDPLGITQSICYHLHDSLPRKVLHQWEQELAALEKEKSDSERRKRIEFYLDQGHGACLLHNPKYAKIVQENLLYFNQKRYQLHAWVIMPNHVHILFTQLPGWDLSRIVHSWKSYTSHEISKDLGTKGKIWQDEFYDRFIRDENHFSNTKSYIERNPVKARLCQKAEDWPWSSAFLRATEEKSIALTFQDKDGCP